MKKIKDPFGNQIIIQQGMLKLTDRAEPGNEVLDDISTVIEKPAMMFKMNGSGRQLFYMRAVGWDKIVLISVQYKDDYFEVTNCEIDPSAKRLSELYLWADQII